MTVLVMLSAIYVSQISPLCSVSFCWMSRHR